MRGLTLYLRSRRIPAALAAAAAVTTVMWALWSVSSNSRDVGIEMVALTVLLLVATLTATLSGPDDALDRTTARPWPPRRATHLIAAFLTVVLLLAATLVTGARFAPAWLVVRDTAGLLGLTALAATTIGTARAWIPPLGWTLPSALFARDDPVAAQVITWPAQPVTSTAAGVTAAVLALAGLIAYTTAGPARRSPAEAAQH